MRIPILAAASLLRYARARRLGWLALAAAGAGAAALVRSPILPLLPLLALQLLAEGMSNKEIARVLSLSPRTVNFHLDNIYAKLGVNSRTEAAIYALRRGWTKRPR